MSVLALPLQAALSSELLIKARDASALVRALGLEQRVLRLRCMLQEGRWASEHSSAHAAGFSRSHACTHRKAAAEVISLSSCGGSNKHYRESEKARKRELGILFSGSESLRPAAAQPQRQCRAPEAGAPRGTPSQGRRARSLAERKRPASAAAPGCVSTVSTAISCAWLRSCAKAALRSLPPAPPGLEMPDVGHRLLRHALDLALLLARAVGWTVRMLYILERRPRTPGSWRGRSRRRACPAGPSPRWPWCAPLPRARSGPSRGLHRSRSCGRRLGWARSCRPCCGPS